MMNCRRT